MERVNRQRFLKRAGAATGAAAFVGVPGIAKAVTDDSEPAKVVAKPGPVTKEPVARLRARRRTRRGDGPARDARDDVPRPRPGATPAQGGAGRPPRARRGR